MDQINVKLKKEEFADLDYHTQRGINLFTYGWEILIKTTKHPRMKPVFYISL